MSLPLLPLSVIADLTVLYSTPDRRYHNIEHIHHCIRELDDALGAKLFTDDEYCILYAAIWFHDAIYDSRSKFNEDKSAYLALSTLEDLHRLAVSQSHYPSDREVWDLNSAELVENLIRSTAHFSNRDDKPLTKLQLFMQDIDLAILGADPKTYYEYSINVRYEYSHLTDEQWNLGRKAVLENFLARERIYLTSHFNNKYEHAARENMKKELKNLETARYSDC